MTTVSFILLGLFAGATAALAYLASSARQTPAKPIISVASQRLQAGWHQIDIAVVTADPDRYIGARLRRTRPRSARLLAPVSTIQTKQGAFQVWTDPSQHKPAAEIFLDVSVEPRETGDSIAAAVYAVRLTAWLFLPENSTTGRTSLELVLLDRRKRAHRYRLAVDQQQQAA